MTRQCSVCRRILSESHFSCGSCRCRECSAASARESRLRAFESRGNLADVYYNMMRRCRDTSNSRYGDYGGRGIFVCREWAEDRESFFRWAKSHGYRTYLQLDRIDNSRGYSPSNCRFVTRKENQRNTRRSGLNNDYVSEIRNSDESLAVLSERYGISKSMVSRIRNGKRWN